MSQYANTKIYEALRDHLVDLTFTPALPIAWPNYDIAGFSGNHLVVSFLPMRKEQITCGDSGLNRHSGYFQIDVMWLPGTGSVAVLETAGAIAAHFKRGTVLPTDLGHVRIIHPPLEVGPVQERPLAMYPVSVRYQMDTSNPA